MLDDLRSRERKVSSQNGEDGVIEAIFAAIGVTNRYFVEFGCGDATECNAAHLTALGWSGLFMDERGASRNPGARVRQETITAENVNAVLAKHAVPPRFDLLSIDIDGNDFWVWKALTYRPRVVVCEYNAHISPAQRLTIPYDPSFRWRGTDYFGASLRALYELAHQKGLELVYCESTGTNAFFVESSELPPQFHPAPIDAIYRPPNYCGRGLRHPHDGREMMDPM